MANSKKQKWSEQGISRAEAIKIHGAVLEFLRLEDLLSPIREHANIGAERSVIFDLTTNHLPVYISALARAAHVTTPRIYQDRKSVV